MILDLPPSTLAGRRALAARLRALSAARLAVTLLLGGCGPHRVTMVTSCDVRPRGRPLLAAPAGRVSLSHG